MNKPWDEPISQKELEVFKSLPDIQVVFDVGARTSLDYYEVKPESEYHLFEPYPPFYEYLQDFAKDKPNIYVNTFGLGDFETIERYGIQMQAFEGGEGPAGKDLELPIKTLDWYVDTHNITRLDFLKIDTEGYDLKVLLGGKKAIQMARFIQYEHWNDKQGFHDLLEKEFDMEYIGLRNVFCTRKDVIRTD